MSRELEGLLYFGVMGIVILVIITFAMIRMKKIKKFSHVLGQSIGLSLLLFTLACVWWWFFIASDGFSQVFGVLYYGIAFILSSLLISGILYFMKRHIVNVKQKDICKSESILAFRESNLINIRNTTKEDIEFICDLEADQENSQFIIPWTKEKHSDAITDDDIFHFVIEDKNENKRVGYIILAGLTNPNESLELMRITIGPKGRGYGKEAFKLIKEWSFNRYNANRLWLDVKVNNTRAIHLYEKQGFKIEGTLRDCLKSKDGYESLHIMSLLKKEYLGSSSCDY